MPSKLFCIHTIIFCEFIKNYCWSIMGYIDVMFSFRYKLFSINMAWIFIFWKANSKSNWNFSRLLKNCNGTKSIILKIGCKIVLLLLIWKMVYGKRLVQAYYPLWVSLRWLKLENLALSKDPSAWWMGMGNWSWNRL